ncbi:adenosine kinase [Ruegeria pomeroyi]|jgi:sugar/nucleoside kinase (ribokinase family)|uniref:Kinase, pfkB family n=2 Tax=Ruegeria pomeroyi TaxID=89184 RepID=Q5LMI1_RUEPO|nr:adenosine kinase [Ruegeria pomeroyi]HCE70739.1 adenosine kinase [Ruegeria sp.]AAV96807.1 kinase, pfkB family [Ruegeria pomeroyi DSS-3]NVK96350.1 adenosine kinase [Ruegeria pomeroyi]NVK99685.1 adenosine kinase [Ruegeria pomeroyi]QWV10338.1 adenosine kinase [Ruegeria pomeroyi]
MKTYDVVGIGNAVVDVISQADDSFLDLMGIEKGIMQLIEQERGEVLYASMKERVQTPGGSVANTIAGAGALGLDTAFIGRVRDDALGHFYADAMNEGGIDFVNPPVAGELATSRSMIFVSPDGERSMNTYLGISTTLSSADVPQEVTGNAKLMFLEGYLFDHDAGKSAFREAARATRAAGGKAGIAISDPFCVDRHRADFLSLIQHDLDFVIGNEAEIQSLFETDHLDDALMLTSGICPLVVCTRSGDGVTVMDGTLRIDVPVEKVVPVDATGAGDQFAAGFLFGMATGRDYETCARIGNICAREVISHIGPRPEANMVELLKENGLL